MSDKRGTRPVKPCETTAYTFYYCTIEKHISDSNSKQLVPKTGVRCLWGYIPIRSPTTKTGRIKPSHGRVPTPTTAASLARQPHRPFVPPSKSSGNDSITPPTGYTRTRTGKPAALFPGWGPEKVQQNRHEERGSNLAASKNEVRIAASKKRGSNGRPM